MEEWAAGLYPDVEPDSAEWEAIRQYYFWEQEALEEDARDRHEQATFEASLATWSPALLMRWRSWKICRRCWTYLNLMSSGAWG